MPTAAERQALIFLAAVALVGGAVRAVGVHRFEQTVGGAGASIGRTSTGAPRNGSGDVALQIAAVDSARNARAAKSSRKRVGKRAASAAAVTPVATGARSSIRTGQPRLSQRGDVPQREPLDVNGATTDELEALPRVGPALAKRIIDYRTEHGRFEGLDDLRHVRGIGVTTAALLAPLVTFSSGYRPIHSELRRQRRDSLSHLD